MRILIVDTCYPPFLRRHYEVHPGLEQRPYAEQWRSLMETGFGTADAYSHYLGELGHEAHEVVANCRPLQDAWLREAGQRPRLPWRLRVTSTVLAQIHSFGPDVVYFQNLHLLPKRVLAGLRRSVRLVAQLGSSPPDNDHLRQFHLLLTSFPHFVARLRSAGLDARYFRIGFDERVLRRLEREGAPLATEGPAFVGSLRRTQHAHSNRLLERAASETDISFWGYGANWWAPGSAVRRRYRGEAWGLDMYRVLRAAKISLNRHGHIAEEYANNMRLYEATGVGSLLLTDEKSNLGELFTPGVEVATYRDERTLVDAINRLLEHEDERREMAAAGQRRTLDEHTYAHRMRELSAILEEAL